VEPAFEIARAFRRKERDPLELAEEVLAALRPDPALIKEIQEIDNEREVFLAKEISKIHEKYIKAKASFCTDSNLKGILS
jgi:hypothetical protein